MADRINTLPASLLEPFQIIHSRVPEDLDPGKKKILVLHDLVGDPMYDHLRDGGWQKFEKLVFVSHWQKQQFQDYLGVPPSAGTVIKNAVEPFEDHTKEYDKIRLIYTSTPHRGLEILVPVFCALADRYPNIELDVFSSFGIYGPNWEERDKQFEPLFQRMREHPQINYHGWADQETVRAAYQRAHIFAYPCIWQETFCRSLAEAMSAGCLAVHPNFSALTETSGGLTVQYNGDHEDHNLHANIFAHTLMYAIENVQNNDLTNLLGFIKTYADTRYSWESTMPKWKGLIASLKEQRTIKNSG